MRPIGNHTMKTFLLPSALFLCLYLPACASITKVQFLHNNTICSSSSGDCKITAGNTTAGHAGLYCATLSTSSDSITSVSGAGATWVHAPNTNAVDATVGAIDCYYTLSLTTATTPVIDGVPTTTNHGRAAFFAEYSSSLTSPTFTYVDSNGADRSSSSTTQAGIALSATSGNVIVQYIKGAAAPSSITTYADFTVALNSAAADLINTSSGTAPTWTIGASNKAVANAVALKENAGSATKVVHRVIGGSLEWSPWGLRELAREAAGL